MRAIKASLAFAVVLSLYVAVVHDVDSAEKCCECGCEYKLKKVYKPMRST